MTIPLLKKHTVRGENGHLHNSHMYTAGEMKFYFPFSPAFHHCQLGMVYVCAWSFLSGWVVGWLVGLIKSQRHTGH